uniref:SRCR domain-containing protein n=1 Tax=Callorhinchus milii TaxID=7868 RepID=A0A4W3GMU3_CALMI
DDEWDMADAHVVCRSLGYANATQAVTGGRFGSGAGPILLDDVRCLGTERSLINCKTKGWSVHDCEHWEAAGVRCDTNQAEFPGYHLERPMELQQSLSLLYLSQKHCQVKILVLTAQGGPVRLHLCAHRLILALSQDGNMSVCEGECGGGRESLTTPCPPPPLRYFYTKSMDITLASVRCVHELASSYGVRALREACHQLLYQLLPQDRSFALQLQLYSYAEAAQEAELRGLCLRYLALNCQAFSQSSAWLRLEARQLSALLLRSDLVLHGELSLYRAVEAWLLPRAAGPGLRHELLGRLRFAMFSPEQLVALQSQRGPELQRDSFLLQRLLQAFRFHSLPVARLGAGLGVEPRIYTGPDWTALLPLEPADPGAPPDPAPALRYDGFRYVHQLSFRRPASPGLTFSTARFPSRYYSSVPDPAHPGPDPAHPGPDPAHPDPDSAHPGIAYRNLVLFLCGSQVALALPLQGGRAAVPSFTALGPHFSCDSGFSALRFVVRPTVTH